MPRLILYGRPGCHLCVEMQAGLEDLLEERGLDLALVDVDGDPALAERYGQLVPVLTLDGEAVCHYFLDRQALLMRLGP